ncbi:T9SS type B sorting domain-containing protein [Flavobacterium hungaricum]|uniref:PKD/Chitinase domain-containing protein n=1 Tax=Flavobacterium hungaricum TaxID=2082725 RepID=A0ABR9TS47_9FLAO|nr:T9SS type B sorting domain-containing protein [Flavobacterium hungaricum]MBE8727599.1 hypothetical protein [Flavobacterium hungaricum]
MKKPTILKIAILFLLFLQCDIVMSQNLKTFDREYNAQLKGDILVIGNNILNRRETNRQGQVTASPNDDYNGTGLNGNFDMRYINIDNGATAGIFSSSSANLTVPNNRAPASPCYRVAYAALYWAATLNGTNRANINKVKFKVPNTSNSNYQDITGTIIHDITTRAGGINPDNTQAYACFADVTNLLSATNPNGTYTVANVISSEGSNGGTGLSAGWSLFIVYEDSSLPTKAISTFNGFTARQQGGGPNNTTITGFTTIPTGPVQARFAFAALEGDLGYTGDYLQINGTTITPPTRPRIGNANNFFNSTINTLNSAYLDRTPKSTNTLGFDTGVIDIDPSAGIIKNNDTSATITLATNTDVFIYYFTAFSVDIIAPKIVLTKGVKDINNNDASGKDVTLGEELRYELVFKNEGNDNAKSFTITDKLPINTDFNFPSDLLELPPGMTIPTTAAGNSFVQYNPTTRTLTFTIPNSYVAVLPTRSPEYKIRFKVKVVDDCSKLTDACSNLIQNTAMTSYVGDRGGSGTNYGDSSYASTAGCNIVPQSTNFLVGLDACKNRRTEICTTSMTISASGGYKSYSWSTNSSGTPVIGTNQTLTITQPGTYYVYNTANPPCIDLQEIITVVDGGGVRTNPIIPYADNRNPDGTITGCLIDGKPLPKIYLCGSNDTRLINLNLSGATIVWEKTTCARPTDLSELCADERTSCTWVSAGANGSLFTVNEAGYYRVTIDVNGCINRYYFNVYKSDVSITETHKNIICYNKGNITAQLLAGYEYSLTKLGANGNTTNYQDSNVFDIWEAGNYVINYRLKNVPNTCVYKSHSIEILSLTMDPKVENPNEQPNCYGENGSITVSATAGFANYYFVLLDGSTVIQQVGPITANVYTFTPAPGKYYTVEVYTMNGNTKECSGSTGKYINNPASEIILTANAITPLTACSEGKYKISASGGSGGYSFFVDGSTTPQASSDNDNYDQNAIIILTPTARDYVIRVRDSKLCEKTITVKVASLPAPVYTVSHTNSNCYDGSSEIRINLTNANGYTMAYSINDGGTYQASPIFSNLSPGNYKVKVKYSITYPITNWPNSATQDCFGPTENVTITGPSSALTASAGVAALAGCTLPDGSGVNQGGKLRINNAQGGTPGYQYSFDGGATWQTSNEKNVLPGTYILVIRDALGCTYTIPYDIILDPRPSDPTIRVEDPVFNCNGTATSTVTVTNGTSSNYSYEYYLDGVANTPISNNVFTNVPSGSHTVSVKYNVTTVSTYSNLLQEDFGKGTYTTTPGINPAYCFEDESTPHPVGYPCGDFNDYQINDGKYAVASSIKTNFGNSWIFAKDHTLPAHPLGRFLCVNVGGSAGIGGILYSKPIKDVIINQPVIISLWAENLIVKTSTSHADPKLTIQLVNNLNGVGGTETIVATTDTANPWVVPKTEKWEYKELSLNPGAYNNLSFVIRSYSNEFNGNDVLIDDIWVRQIPESCIAQKNFPIVIDSNKAFSASVTGFKDLTCVGSNNGEITIAAQNFNLPYGFDYSLDNGATWINSKVSPVTATGLSSKTYNIRVRYDNSASSCVFPLTQVIKAPTAIAPTAIVTKEATCTTGATITAGATGGTPAYQFQLMNGATIVTPFQTTGIFTNVPTGSYTVVVRDSNTCVSSASAAVTVVAPNAPTASLAATSDLCYDTTNQSTLVVTATGTGTLTYSLDGATPQNSNTFTNVGPGTHNIVVTDSNNCTATVSNIVIAPQLQGEAKITGELNCTTTPNASITVTITGGTSGFTYKVRKGTGSYGSSTAVTGSSFVYTGANTADTYYFEITDSKGCVVTVSAIVNTIVNPTVDAQKVDATCNGASTGSVQLAGAGGSGGYSYLFYSSTTTPVPTAFITQSNYTGLAAGTYSYQVMDSKGCKSAVGTITITQPTTLTATASATTFTCNASNVKQAATVTIAVPTTGTAPYEYSFDGGTTFTSTRTLSVTDNGTNQTISYVVKDAQGCQTPVQTIIINRLNPPTDLAFSAAAVTCTATTTTVTATATNGVAPLTFAITSPAGSAATNTTGVFAGLASGVYNFRVTDANGCYYNEAFTINAATPIVVTPAKTSDVLCRGGNTGSGTYTVSGNATVGAYTYTITPATGTVTKSGNVLTLTNAAAGTYTVQVTDNTTGCTSSANIVITQPAVGLSVASAVASNVSCSNDNSEITVTAAGGTPNYTYAFAKNPSTVPTSAYGNSNILTVDTNSGADRVWDVYVKDVNGCTAKSTVTVVVDALPAVTNVTVNNQCTASGTSFTITATATGLAPLTYSIDGTNFQSSPTFTVAAGSYTVTVKDKNNCTASAPAATVVYPQLTAVGDITKELDCSASPNAVITVLIGGGRAPFTYTVQKGSGTVSAPSAPITGPNFTLSVTAANADTYTFVVTDANGCSKTATATVAPISNPTVTAVPVAAACSGNADGSVTLTGAGGAGDYTYSNNATTGFTVNPVFTGLAAGSYTFYVKDGKGCIGSVAVTIAQPLTLAATTSVVGFTCNTSNGKVAGTVTVNVTAGTGTLPYEYSFNGNGFGSGNVLTLNDNGADQPYTYIVRDAKGCTVSGNGILSRLNPPTDLTFAAAAVTCNATSTTVTLTATNGVAALQYETIAPSPVIIAKQTSNSFPGLAPGTYMFKVTDANGCYYNEAFTINPATPIVVTPAKTSDVLCRGGNTGSGTYTVTGIATAGAYTYTITPATGTVTKSGNVLTLTNAVAGTYTVQVTDTATGCTGTAAIVIDQPAVALTVALPTATNVSCNNDNSQITVTASGGTPNYTYAFAKNPSTVPTSAYGNSNILTVDTNSGADRVWDVYVKDVNGCTAKSTVTVIVDALPAVTNVTVNNQCTASGTSFTITAAATGLAPLTYSIDGTNFQSSPTFTVAAGSYTVTVKDKNNCTASAPAATVVYPQLTAVGDITKELDCSASPNAVITVLIGGGRAPFTYTVQKGSGTVSAPSAPITGPNFTLSVTAANADTYTFVVTDANGCSKTATATVAPISNPTVTAVPVAAACNGNSDGSVTLTGAGGAGDYTYSNNATTGFTVNPVFTGLAAGSYTFYVKDGKGCIGSVAVTITQPLTLAATTSVVGFTCNTANGKVAGTVTVNVTAGTGTLPYQYRFNGQGFGSNNVLTLNDTGVDQPYTYEVRDAKGCIVSGSGTLLRLNPPTDLTFAAAAVTCTATTTTVTLTATNGVGALQYETIAPSPVIIAKQTSNSFAGLAPGTYMFRVTDANGCYYTEAHTINPVTPITLVVKKTSDVLCRGGNTGSIRLEVAGFAATSTYSYTVNGGTAVTGNTAAIVNIPNLTAGNYVIVVTDETTGCSETESITINQPAADLTAGYTAVNANCFVTTSAVTVTATGGTPVYRYSFVHDGDPAGTYTNNNKANLDPTIPNWDVYILDANNCSFKLDISITRDAVPTVTASATGQCFGVGSYTITATPGAGLVAPLSYSINNGASYQPGNTFVITTPGNYTVRIKDGNGCTADSNVVIVNNPLTLSAILDKDITCSNPTAAQVTLTAAGGAAAYTYTSSPNTGTFAGNVFTTNTPGSYTFTVTDSRGCTATSSAVIITPTVTPEITAVSQTQTINCSGEDTAAISVTYDATKGLAPFVINVLNNTTGTDYGTQTSGLAAGNYTITVTDARGCFDTETITINEPLPISVAHHAVPITCNTTTGISKGSVIVDSVTGGVGPYNYYVTGVNGYNNSELNNLGTTSVSFNVVDFGLYQINVVDRNGCSVLIQNVLVASPPQDLDITVTAPPANCSSLGSAVVAIGATSTNITGNGPFHFAVYTGPGMTYTAPTALPWYDEDVLGVPAGVNPGSKKATIPNLIPGVQYTFVVHDALTGCYYFETATMPIPTNSTLTTTALTSNNITCKGSANGNVTFTVNSTYPAATPISYEIYNSQSMASTGVVGTGSVPANGSLTVSNLGPLTFGNYIVVIRETAGATNAGCSIGTASFNITESAIDLSITASVSKNANCNPASGVITAIAKDGTVTSTSPYMYLLLPSTDPAPTAATLGWVPANTFNRDAGTYTVYVKDAYGCIKSATVTLDKDDEPTIIAPPAFCYNGTAFNFTIGGTVDPAIVGGATYSVDGSVFQTSPTFTFNAAKVYNLVIKDGNGCTATTTFEVKPQLFLEAKLTRELDCTGTPNAEITLTATGGYNTAYTYEYSTNGGTSYTTMASNVLSTSVLGNYIFRVSDAKLPASCQATTTFTLDPLPAAVFTTAQTDVICNGGSDGTITVTVTSGFGPYQYQLDGGAFQASNVFTGLSAGTSYIITVRDAKSCTYSSTPITIAQPSALTATSAITAPLACGTGNAPTKAVVTITVPTGSGTAPYKYSYDNGTTYTDANTYETYAGTTFNVLVKDAHGCIFTLTNGVNVPALNRPTDMDIAGTPIYCAPAANTTSTVTISNVQNGVGTLQYEILSPIVVAKQNTPSFAGLAPDTYLFQVTDANGCTYQESYTVKPVTNITIAGQLVSNVTCNGNANGAVRFTVANFGTTYTAALTAGTGSLVQTGNTVNVTGLVAGNYTVTVTDNTTNCTAFATVTVTEPPVLALNLVHNINANCNFGARVEVIASGGTPNYRYQFVPDGATPNPADYDIFASAVLDPATTEWDAYVIDANGCPMKLDITVGRDALPTITPAAAPYCYTGGPVNITITGTYVGTPMFSIGNQYQSSPNFVLNAPGNYTFYIKDGNGCIVSTPYTLNQELLLQATLTQDLTCTGAAVITLLATQGTQTYNGFEVSYNSGPFVAATSPYTAAAAGTYVFQVEDSQGCQAVSVPVVVTPTTTPTATFTQTNVRCIGGNDGSIIVTVADGILPYSYSIDGGTTFQSSNIFAGLTAGAYAIVVKDAKNCDTVTIPVTITEPTALAATAVLTQGLTCGTGNAAQAAIVTINVTAGTGTSPYQYSFNGGTDYSATNTYTTLTAGTVTAYVRDANGCVITAPVTVTIPALNKPTDMDISGTPIYCAPAANTTSTVTISNVQNGVGTLQYEILSPIVVAKQNTPSFAGLTPDTYLFQVTDANGCTYQESYTVVPVTNITIAGQLVSNVTCNGNANGAVRFTVANFGTAYTAALTAGTGALVQTGNTVDVTGLAPGNYTVTVTDNTTNCTAFATVTVTEPPVLTLNLVHNINANCNFGARVEVIASGGTPNYRYQFVPDGATPNPADYDTLASAVLDATITEWDAYVIDANGCPMKLDITVGRDALPTITPAAAPYCYTGGPVNITITGTYVGTPMFSIGNQYQSSPNFVLNAPGNYTFYIKDGNGCIVSTPYTLNQELLLEATLTQDLTCTGAAVITLLATQGTQTYNGFEVSYNSGLYVPATSPYTATVDGTYIFRVSDSQGCQAVSVPVTVTPRTTPTATFTQTNVRCTGGSDGSIIVTAANGILPYEYSIDGGTTFQPSNIFAGLTAGAYTIVVKDAKNCDTVTIPVTITEPTALAATAVLTQSLTCGTGNAAQAAIVTINVTAGTGTSPYQYSFNGGTDYSDTNTYTTLTPGTVTAYVRDANGCVITAPVSVTIPALDAPVIDNVTGTPIYCAPAASTTSTVTIAYSHGVGTLHFEILSPASAVGNVTGASNGIFTGLTAGTYIFQVTDANGCKDQETYTVDPLVNITIAGQLVNNVICNGESNGSVKFDVDNFGGAYTATLIGGPTTGTLTQTGKVVTLTNLPIGNYTVEVVDNVTQCRASASVAVTQPDALTLTPATNVNANCNTGAKVSVTAAGGTPNYMYAFMSGTAVPASTDYSNSNSAVLNPATNTAWTAYVMDSKGCIASTPITIGTDPLPSGITAAVASQCPSPTGEYTFTVTVTSGMAPYEYSIGNGFQSSPTFTVNAAGTYDVIVRDANACTVTVPALVTISPALQLETVILALPSCTLNNGEIRAAATGGSGNYRYTIDGGIAFSTTPTTFTGVAPGTHVIRVRDVNTNCSVNVTVEIPVATPITGFDLTGTPVSCRGGSDGTITATIAPNAPGVNDNPVYTYTLFGTSATGAAVNRPAQTNNVFVNLEAGDYTVRVTSGRGCVVSEDFRVLQPNVIAVAAPVIAQYGCTSGTNTSNYATITVSTVTGGSGNYTTYEFFKNGVSVQRGPQNVYTESDHTGGTYTVNVYDDKGCMGSSTGIIRVNPFISLDAVNVTVNAPMTCISNEDVTVTVTSTGGTPALLNYNIAGTDGNTYNQSNTTGVFTGLTIGNYVITVTNPATGCSIQKIHYVNNANTFEIKAVAVNGKICFGTADGIIDLTFVDNQLDPTDDAGIFNYVVTGPVPSSGTSTNAGPVRLTGLTAGQYTVQATLVGRPYCTVTNIFSIEQPNAALALTLNKSNITCVTGNNDGEIAATATGGWLGTYQYQLMNGTTIVVDYSTQSTFSGLSAGTYTVNVKDGQDCPVSASETLVVPAPITVSASANASVLSCYGDDNGVITVAQPTGGQGSNYLYTLTVVSDDPVSIVGPQIDPVFTGLKAGRYVVTVTDGYSCQAASTEITISNPTRVEGAIVLSRTQTCLTLAQITLSATGGTGSYTYSTDGVTPLGSFTSAASITFDVPVGNYKYFITDTNGCTSFVTNEIENPALIPLNLKINKSSAVVKCKGEASASIVAEGIGGVGNYVYTLLDNAGNVVRPAQADGTFDNLVFGTYRILVVSDDCRFTSDVITIEEPATPIAAQFIPHNVTCFGANDGKIEVIASGGTGKIQYAIYPDLDKFDTIAIFEKLTPGDYQIVVKDDNGCSIVETITITQPTVIKATELVDMMIPEYCAGDKDGAIYVEVDDTSGTAPYTASIDDEDGPFINPDAGTTNYFSFTGLSGGQHIVYIKDANGCMITLTSNSMPVPVTLNPVIEEAYECENDLPIVKITVTVDSSISEARKAQIVYTLLLDGTTVVATQTGNPVFRIPASGNYSVRAELENCAKVSNTIAIVVKEPLTLIDVTKTLNKDLNTIQVKASGGVAPYTYSFNNEPFTSSNSYRIYETGLYNVTVMDSNGCKATIQVPGTFYDFCLPNYFTPDGDGRDDLIGPACGALAYKNLTFDIFDRYGRVVAKYHVGEKWDGRYNGAELPTGDYWYVLKLNDEKDNREFVGHFTLYR